jgi:hypothetical protein
MKLRIAFAVLLALVAGVRTASAQVPPFRHVFVIVMENHEYEDVIGNPAAPYINRLSNEYGLATSAFGVTHPSLPNYMALTGGDTFFTNDCVGCQTAAANLADRIEASGRTWTAYLEDMPAPCSSTDAGLYVAKHNPFVHYSNITSNAARCSASVVPFSRFSTDLSSGRLADFVWISPNLCNDMHDCSVATGDAWLSGVVPQILQSAAFADSLLLITFDEGVSSLNGGGHIPLIVASSRTPAGTRSSTLVTHYSVLRTIEDAWSLPPLGQSANANAMSDFFPGLAAPPSEQVIYADDATLVGGSWKRIADASAASGLKLSNADGGAALITAPQAAPDSYIEAAFDAAPHTRYRVWLRIHASGDSKFNDSVWVQFSDSVDAQGLPIYRAGTTSGYIVNLWVCATCQSVGWGWQRNAYWLADSGDVWFPSAGRHTIRVQVREDGAEIDQIVISPSQYVTTAPGPVSGDATIVPKPVTPPPMPPATPTGASPANAATGLSTSTTLSWSAAGATRYDVNFGTANPPPRVATGQPGASYSPALAAGTTYFWQIVAGNASGSVTGPVWSFTTAAQVSTHPEIVIYASDIPASAMHGVWTAAADSTAAGGVKLVTPDNGFAATDAALAAPTNYVDVPFTADGRTDYTLWIRIKALNNSKFNDSLWVQFAGALAAGSNVYTIGSTAALNVNLATSSTATSLNNWGWQNGAYWLSQPVTVSFATTGPHTMRIQIREDGVQFDQIVLSSTRFLTSAPGAVTSDATIVAKP